MFKKATEQLVLEIVKGEDGKETLVEIENEFTVP